MSSRQRVSSTPLYNAWLDRLADAVAAPGEKTRLARHMAALRGQPVHTWQNAIARISRTGSMLNAEDLLQVTAWMDARADA